MKKLAFILILFVQTILIGQSISIKKGKIIDSIPVKNAVEESFALYLPTTFDANVNSAIIFIYDPAARGSVGLESFIPAADLYNYILVCSNNSKNGPYNENFEIANKLFQHIFSEFKTDPKQIYTAGFSGGSRLATTIAVLTKSIQGVIGCGAGFMTNISEIENTNGFSYVGLVGDEDMNFQEMFKFMEWLKKYNIENELLTFEGGHHWPPKKQILRAMGWLELQAYKKNIRSFNEDKVNYIYKENYKLADSLEREGQSVLAVMEYERMLRNLGRYFKLDSISKKTEELKTTNEYENEIEIRHNISKTEDQIFQKFYNRFDEESILATSKDDFNWWRSQLKKLVEDYKNSNNYFASKMRERLIYGIKAMAYESSEIFSSNNRLERALYCDKLLTILAPEQPYYFVRLAKTYAKINDFRNTISNLEKAFSLGYKNIEYIKSEEEFNKFKGKKKYDKFLISIDKPNK